MLPLVRGRGFYGGGFYKSIADHSEDKLINSFANYDCLLVDEV
jgi:hypothetical protein